MAFYLPSSRVNIIVSPSILIWELKQLKYEDKDSSGNYIYMFRR
jgi:hypothetical protein